MASLTLSDDLRSLARSCGLDALGFAPADEFTGYRLTGHPRRDPRLTLASAESIIVAGVYIGGLTLPQWSDHRYGRTSRLYLSGFFLDVAEPLQPIVDHLTDQGFRAVICNTAVEGGSILPLKLAGVRAGLGWQGKHSLLISKEFGTFLALGGIITDADLDWATEQEPNRCGKCEECREACPVGALERPHLLEVGRCVSYRLSVEDLPEEVKAAMENRVGDCEICQEVCPWNLKHLKQPLMTSMTGRFREMIDDWGDEFELTNLSRMTEGRYRELFGPLKTGIPFEIFQRNVGLALARAERLGSGR